MKVKQRIQPTFNDEMSFTDIIQFLILNRRVITTFIILGALLGGLYGQFSQPIYNGSILLAPAKISGALIENPQKTISIFKAKYSDLSKETNLSCPKDSFEYINFRHSDNSNLSIPKEITFIKISMQNTVKATISNCLNQIADEISLRQNKIAQPLINFKKNQAIFLEKYLKTLSELSDKTNQFLNSRKTNTNNEILLNITLKNLNEERVLLALDRKNNNVVFIDELANKVSSVEIKRNSFPSFKYGVFYGILLGFGLGLLISLLRQIKVSLSL